MNIILYIDDQFNRSFKFCAMKLQSVSWKRISNWFTISMAVLDTFMALFCFILMCSTMKIPKESMLRLTLHVFVSSSSHIHMCYAMPFLFTRNFKHTEGYLWNDFQLFSSNAHANNREYEHEHQSMIPISSKTIWTVNRPTKNFRD